MAITRSEKFYQSTSKENIKIRYLEWKDDANTNPVGVVQLTHGWGEYIDRYDDMARMLAENGYVVVGQDHIAHGYTAGVDYLGIYPEDAHTAMVEDMQELYKIYHQAYPNAKYCLYGHSMGSMLARCFLKKYSNELDAAVICGTGNFPGAIALLIPVLKLVYKIGPSYKTSIQKAADKAKTAPKSTEHRTDMPKKAELLPFFWLSYDEANIIEYVQNPYDGAPYNTTLAAMAQMMVKGTTKKGNRKIKKDLPIFIISGAKDPVGLWSIGVKQAYKNLVKIGRNATLKIYNGRHEIHNEVENGTKNEVFADLLAFFNAACK